MSRGFCRICGGIFPSEQLLGGSCGGCQALKAQPHARHAVFGANDIDYHGKSRAWLAVVAVLLLLTAGFSLARDLADPPGLAGADFVVIEAEDLLLEDPLWLGAAAARARQDLTLGVARFRTRLKSSNVGPAPLRTGRYDISVKWEHQDPWIIATPTALWGLHYLITTADSAHVALGEEAEWEDPLIDWPPEAGS